MPNKPSWRLRSVWIGALVALAGAAGFVWFDRSPPPATAYRHELLRRDGLLLRPADGRPFDGLMIEEWRAGVRRAELPIVAGRAHGRSRGWYENGRLEIEEHFVHGVSHGPRQRWYEDGRKKSEAEIRDGVLVGTFREWHPNGRLARETPLADGVPHGLVRSWDADGRPTGTARVERGQLVTRN